MNIGSSSKMRFFGIRYFVFTILTRLLLDRVENLETNDSGYCPRIVSFNKKCIWSFLKFSENPKASLTKY